MFAVRADIDITSQCPNNSAARDSVLCKMHSGTGEGQLPDEGQLPGAIALVRPHFVVFPVWRAREGSVYRR